jgi:hypothetical protein
LEVKKRSSRSGLNVCEYFRYGVSNSNFCLLGIIFEVQSVKSPVARAELAHTLNTPELSRIAKKVLVTILRRSRPISIALPAGSVVVAWTIIIARPIIAAIVCPTIIVWPWIVGAVIIPAVIGLRVGWAEVIEQKREWERDAKTHALGLGWELGETQGANGKQKNQQLFHLECTSGDRLRAYHKTNEKGS